MTDVYGASFYSSKVAGSRASADAIVPLVLDMIPAGSVIDVGCGLGTWLAAFAAHGVTDVLGIDGDHVDRQSLQIPVDHFVAMDIAKPLSITRRYDLALSLETAEHLDPGLADDHVEQLTRLAPVVLFSAAIPGQGGTHHVNEQWPEYWASRFASRSYRAVDAIRPRLARFTSPVDFWYAQNIVLYVEQSRLASYSKLAPWADTTAAQALAWVHPSQYQILREELVVARRTAAEWAIEANSIRRTIARLPLLFWSSGRRRLARLFC